jgi:hypothetical protein
MYNSNPYPPPRSRTQSTNTLTSIRRPIPPPSSTANRIQQQPSTTSSRHVIAHNSIFAGYQDHIPLGSSTSSGLPVRTSKARYNYKVRPVVYTNVAKPHGSTSSTTPQHSPTRPSSSATNSNNSNNNINRSMSPTAPGAIANFFDEVCEPHCHFVF